jgi:NTE family protein
MTRGEGEGAAPAGTPDGVANSDRSPLPTLSLFEDLDPDARASLVREADRVRLPAGYLLFEQGDAADALYVVLSGCLSVMAADPAKGRSAPRRLVNHIYAGQTVGEMGLLAARPRTATIVASRDTSLLRITRDMFERLVRTHSGAMFKLSAQLVDRLEKATLNRTFAALPRTLALIPVDPAVPSAWLAAALGRALVDGGAKTCILTQAADEVLLDRIEGAHELTVYAGRADDPAWTRAAIGRADRVFLVASPATVEATPPAGWRTAGLPWRTADLIVVQSADARVPAATTELLRRIPARRHWHVRKGNEADVARLGRHLRGRALGVVFSGGGARGYAHLGIVRALREIGIPLDLVGGASFGAIVAAGVASEWGDEELLERFREGFARSNPLSDYAMPFVALTKGRKVSRQLRAHFGDRRVEDLWRPFFTVAANLTTGSLSVLKEGAIWEALRASIALPGLLPPWIANGEVFVDGAVMNNLPADVMRSVDGGVIVAVDVTRYETLRAFSSPRGPWIWRLLTGQQFGGPSIVSTLLRSAHVGSDVQTRLSREAADLVLEPPLADVDLRDWKAIDRAAEAGYRHAMTLAGELRRVAFHAAEVAPVSR